MQRALLLAGLVVVSFCSLGMSQRKTTHLVSFHVQADPLTTPAGRMFEWPPGSRYYYEKTPTIHQKQITSFTEFDGDDDGWGAIFRLNTGGRNALAAAVATHPGKYLCAVVQTTPRAIVKLNDFRDDGQIVIWEKLTKEDMAAFEKKIPWIRGGAIPEQ